MISLESIPNELLLEIGHYLTPRQRFKYAWTSRRIWAALKGDIARDKRYWARYHHILCDVNWKPDGEDFINAGLHYVDVLTVFFTTEQIIELEGYYLDEDNGTEIVNEASPALQERRYEYVLRNFGARDARLLLPGLLPNIRGLYTVCSHMFLELLMLTPSVDVFQSLTYIYFNHERGDVASLGVISISHVLTLPNLRSLRIASFFGSGPDSPNGHPLNRRVKPPVRSRLKHLQIDQLYASASWEEMLS